MKPALEPDGALAEDVPCLSCGSPSGRTLVGKDRNRAVSDVQFPYHRCSQCDLLFLADVPEELDRYYGQDYYQLPDIKALTVAAERDSYQISQVLRHVQPPGRLVEVGPAWGVFSLQAKQAGFSVTGVEMDARCVEYLRATVGVDAVQSNQPEQVLPGLAPLDAVVMWQVLEHVRDPRALLGAVAEALRPGGVVVLATPNPESLGFRLMRRSWPHLDAPRHVTLIPAALLRSWSEGLGLAVVEVFDTDVGAKRWNRFAWQRLLENRWRHPRLHLPLHAAGAVLSAIASPWEGRPGRGASYTAVLRKAAA